MKHSKTHSIFGVTRTFFAIQFMLIGILVLNLAVPLPNMKYKLSLWANDPSFIHYTMEHSLKTEDTEKTLTQLVLSRWGWVESGLYKLESKDSTEQEYPSESNLLPAMPSPVVKEELQNESQPSQTLTGDWITKTMTEGSTHVQVGQLYIANSGKVSVSDFSVPTMAPVSLEKNNSQPQILIYHSHGTESYSPTVGYEYTESDPYRTTDQGRNILTVGEAMKHVFESAGYSVIHDTNFHDYPDYNSSYSNSAQTLRTYLEKYPSISLIFDVHRDALEDTSGTPYQLVSQQGEDTVAQVMLVVGSNGDGYEHSNWRENFSLALFLQQNLKEYGDFARPITLRSSRFNQHLSPNALLVEIGGHGNTLQQAIDAGILFAQSVVDSFE